MLLPQTDPTPQEIITYCETAGGRLDLAWTEIIRLLRTCLPGAVTLFNTQFGRNVQLPSDCYYVQNEAPGDEFQTPAIFVGASIDTRGTAPLINEDTVHISLYVLTGMAERKPEIDDSFILAYLARGTMKKAQRGWCLPDGRMVWNSLLYRGITPLPDKWAKYSGATVHFECEQAGLDLWTPPTP